MTEAEWLVCTDPEQMLDYLGVRACARKLRLFIVADQRSRPVYTERRARRAIDLLEAFADGACTEDSLTAAWKRWPFRRPPAALETRAGAQQYARLCCDPPPPSGSQGQANMLRCLFSNPFRPVSLEPVWRTPTVLALATAAAIERILPACSLDSERLAILADALEEGGCTESEVLHHLRGSGPHVRGCWPVDLILEHS